MRKKIVILLILIFIFVFVGFIYFFYLKQKIILFKKEKITTTICQQLNYGLLTKNINDIAMTNNGELYVGTDIGMFKSIDYGKSWHIINEGLNINNQAPYITKIIIDDNPKYDRTIIYALVGKHISKIFKSYDKGMNWFEEFFPEGYIIDIDVAQGYNGNSDLYALSYNNEKENEAPGYKEVYYFNRLIKKLTVGMSTSEFVEHYLKTGSMVEAHWENKSININLEDSSPKKLIMND